MTDVVFTTPRSLRGNAVYAVALYQTNVIVHCRKAGVMWLDADKAKCSGLLVGLLIAATAYFCPDRKFHGVRSSASAHSTILQFCKMHEDYIQRLIHDLLSVRGPFTPM